MKLNINEYVKVKLTDKGRAIHKKQYEELFASCPELMNYRPPREDADGWSKWQLWDLMQRFGPHISLGVEVPFETEIEIETKETV